jgi:endonuclease/exonuclease/phosphatase (EEP) superfamily protein YafD
LLQVSIDHLLHSSELAVADRRLGPPMGSDHLPLVVDLSIVDSRTLG